jgi:hypothetical protein
MHPLQASRIATPTPQNPSQKPRRPRSLDPSLRMADNSSPPYSDTTPAPRKSPFKNIPEWSILYSRYYRTRPAPPPLRSSVTLTTQDKDSSNSFNNSGIPALEKLSEPVFLPQAAPNSCVSKNSVGRDATSNSIDGRSADRGDVRVGSTLFYYALIASLTTDRTSHRP